MSEYIPQLILEAEKVMQNAYMPYSKFPVGSALRTTQNQIFSGCNVENASYRLSICSETSAICSMVSKVGYQKIAEIAIVAKKMLICPPCGACRQTLSEFAAPDILIHFCGDGKVQKTFTMKELLPESFDLHSVTLDHSDT